MAIGEWVRPRAANGTLLIATITDVQANRAYQIPDGIFDFCEFRLVFGDTQEEDRYILFSFRYY
jgi:MoxR-like ATPase